MRKAKPEKLSYVRCHECDKVLHKLGIAGHLASHRRSGLQCEIATAYLFAVRYAPGTVIETAPGAMIDVWSDSVAGKFISERIACPPKLTASEPPRIMYGCAFARFAEIDGLLRLYDNEQLLSPADIAHLKAFMYKPSPVRRRLLLKIVRMVENGAVEIRALTTNYALLKSLKL